MNLSLKSIPAFLLMLGGAAAFGSIYSALLNTVGIDITGFSLVFTLITVFYAFVGYYTYGYLAYGKGNVKVAFGLALLAALLGLAAFLGGKGDTQKLFALHEIINYFAPWLILVALFPSLRK